MKWLLVFLGIGLLSLSAAAAPAAIEVTDIDNNVTDGSDLKIDENGNCQVITATGATALSQQDMIEVNFSTAMDKKSNLWEFTLSNQDVICGVITDSVKDGIKVESPLAGVIDLKFSQLLMIKSPLAGAQKDIAANQSEDMIQLLNGDSDRGVISLINNTSVTLNSSGYKQDKTYALKDLAVIIFSQLGSPPKPPEGIITLLAGTDGSRLTGQVKKIQDGQIFFKSLYGTDYQWPFSKVSQLSFKNPRCIYLSDIAPTAVKEYPTIYDADHIVFPWKYQRNHNVMDTGFISLKGKKFTKGLGVHANCELTYNLNGEYRKFVATAGIDDVAGPQASVQFVVYVDGRKTYESKVLKWGDAPETINLNVEKARELKLVLNDGGDLHIMDRAAWGAARLIK